MALANNQEIKEFIVNEAKTRKLNQKIREELKKQCVELERLIKHSNQKEEQEKLKQEILKNKMSMNSLKEKTDQQIEAIYSNGNNLLLAASAGSGKTFVMIERIIDRISRGIRLTDLFVSTFTNMATNELKERLEKILRSKLANTADTEEKQRYRQALKDLPNSDILTMDSFSGKLIRNYYYLLNIDPNFRLLNDQTEIENLKEEVFISLENDFLMEKYVDFNKIDFSRLIRNFSNDRSDKGFFSAILQIHRFAESTPDPMKWLETEMLSGYQKYQNFNDFPQDLTESFTNVLQKFTLYIKRLIDNDVILWGKKDHQRKIELLAKRIEQYEAYITSLKNGCDISEIIDSFIIVGKTDDGKQLLTLRQIKDDDERINYPVIKSEFDNIYQKVLLVFRNKSVIESYKDYFIKLTIYLQKFSILFYRKYFEAKLDKNLLEYADINHLAIKLLSNNSDILNYYKDKYVEIMVDEYQDTNHMQDTLLNLLSNGKNRFMVGDVKQSIYGFRLADPNLFLEKQSQYLNTNGGQVIRLKENFRSHQEVLHFTNSIFERLFDYQLTNMNYDEAEHLKFGNLTFPMAVDSTNYPELLIYQKDKTKQLIESESSDVEAGEIEIVAQKINELIKSGVPAKDIAVLVRNRNQNAVIESILANHDIPVVLMDGKANYLQSIEIKVMLATLRAINNPYSDIDLVALMRSPMFNFNEDELMKIRLQNRFSKYYDALNVACELIGDDSNLISNELKQKISDFLLALNSWRDFRVTHSIYELILKIYQEKYYLDYVGGLTRGLQRQANLQALLTRAKSFEMNGYKGLFQFIHFIDSYLQRSNDLEEAPIEKKVDAVRVMTIHKSKGLEFPYVFIVNLAGKFNKGDLNKNTIITRENGVSIKALVPYSRSLIEMETIPYTVNKMIKEKNLIAEEMRLLYVALTRAEKKLYLTGTVASASQTVKSSDPGFGTAESTFFDNWKNKIDEKTGILSNSLRISDNYLNWIGGILWSIEKPIKKTFISEAIGAKVTIYTDFDIEQATIPQQNEVSFNVFNALTQPFESEQSWIEDARLAKRILDSADEYNQKNLVAIQMPTIQTPSAIKKRYETLLDDCIQPASLLNPTFDFPIFKPDTKRLSGAEFGSLIHELLQKIDFTSEDLEKEIYDTVANNMDQLIPAEIERITFFFQKIVIFFTENLLGKDIVNAAKNGILCREQPFSMLVDTNVISNFDFDFEIFTEKRDHVLIKGVIDGYFELDDKIILFDYKTDHNVSRETLIQRYRKQIEVYAKALSESLNQAKSIKTYLIALSMEPVEVIEI
ncbi:MULTISPECIES: helicase-exonuclease AddAB subunit AddA [unclassified Enterococcus]|uniref:helicase-exonuclease AddAB subunit AddA n=1 Tax=unclassified Enterococcus TaxID=2608891 RepID=UPI0015557F68|nr:MULTISPECIES: helicase-exonuclease AddAB subunit AddA [unclassified Enterococcus]MBS7577764.1 helicase-exonuclease AddAB subunit AddA [Enterococcus sp. MMGLQ5-2]MBS7585024.1 helicase-exonuclease AddAB subunit AddA [Enterococcus sp. MMGLQ5-1]NPD12880.1 helicase-exonuclease AddAB subunit AddA [Enterococcus sp. MMGLQ5-1]NPD37594.1 helicase-exonuclease AddAB subunit AddA [Enterococcus sp. MMGLQ5-2]